MPIAPRTKIARETARIVKTMTIAAARIVTMANAKDARKKVRTAKTMTIAAAKIVTMANAKLKRLSVSQRVRTVTTKTSVVINTHVMNTNAKIA